MTRLPLDFPPLVEMAEREACDFEAAAASIIHSPRTFAKLLSDLARPGPQALWLRWLAERLGVPVPVVGCPFWRRCNWYLDRQVESYFLGISGAFVVVFGPRTELTRGQLHCSALDNPDSKDASIRALVLAILTVGAHPVPERT